MKSTSPTIRHRLEYLAFRTITSLIACLPDKTAFWISEVVGTFVARMLPEKLTRKKLCRENLARVMPDATPQQIETVIEQMWTHLFRMVVEMVQLPHRMRLETSREVVVFHERAQVVDALTTGRPVIVLSGHFGNWEMAMSTFGMYGFPMGVVARKLDNPLIHEWFRITREQTGHHLILKKGGFEDLTDALAARGSVGMLGDQDAGSRGLFVDFFGTPASTFKSIALLSLEYDALISVGYARRLEDNWLEARWSRYEVGCETVIDPQACQTSNPVKEITEAYTTALEQIVRKNPEQYFWLHRRWKSVPRQRKSRQKTPLADAA